MSMNETKQLIARTFAELGAKDVFNLRETLFLDRGRCMAVAYRADGLSAVWCWADEIIEFVHAADTHTWQAHFPRLHTQPSQSISRCHANLAIRVHKESEEVIQGRFRYRTQRG